MNPSFLHSVGALLATGTLCACGSASSSSDAGAADSGMESDLSMLGRDAGGSDGGQPGVGAAAVKQRIHLAPPTTGTLTTDPVATRTSGSIFLVSTARGSWAAAPDAPTDSRGNTFALVGATHDYAAWPGSATGLFAAAAATGGAGHTFSMTWGEIGGSGDEVTLSAVEVIDAASIEDSSWVERSAATSLTSNPVTTTGPAVLVAWWWGSGGVRPPGRAHVATPGSGFTLVPAASGLISLSSNGYIQVAVASRAVAAAGTYTATWTTDNEGAQLYLVAVRGR